MSASPANGDTKRLPDLHSPSHQRRTGRGQEDRRQHHLAAWRRVHLRPARRPRVLRIGRSGELPARCARNHRECEGDHLGCGRGIGPADPRNNRRRRNQPPRLRPLQRLRHHLHTGEVRTRVLLHCEYNRVRSPHRILYRQHQHETTPPPGRRRDLPEPGTRIQGRVRLPTECGPYRRRRGNLRLPHRAGVLLHRRHAERRQIDRRRQDVVAGGPCLGRGERRPTVQLLRAHTPSDWATAHSC